jgi:phytoene synthase
MTTATVGEVSLEQSRQYCQQLTRSAARNFYYGLKLLPEPKRSAMFALYAYMRLVDDIADGEDGRPAGQRMEELDAWAQHTRGALSGKGAGDGHVVWPAFVEMAIGCNVPGYIFEEVIAGQRQDLNAAEFENFSQLKEYCYRVAGVVGLASIHIWGFEGGASTEALAVERGIAFQLTNILRDLREDAARGRTYLPLDELRAAGISPGELHEGTGGAGFVELMHRQIARAQSYYDSSAALDGLIARDSRSTLVAMTQIYHGLLEKVKANPQRVLRQRVSLSPFSKLRIAWRAARSR